MTKSKPKLSTSRAKSLITRFENAVRDHAFIGTIPAGESDEAAAMYEAVQDNYERAKANLIKFCIDAVIGEGSHG